MLRTGFARCDINQGTAAKYGANFIAWFAVVIISLAALLPTQLHAQELRGLVLSPDGVTPASGVVVVLIHATKPASIVARSVTTDRGRFVLKTPPRTPTALRLLRIGFEPMDGGTVTLDNGETRDATFTLHDTRVRLAAIDVKATSRCQVQPSGAQLVAQLFQQARTALISSTTQLYRESCYRGGELQSPTGSSSEVADTCATFDANRSNASPVCKYRR